MAGFGRNGSRPSAKVISAAERRDVWIALRRQGHSVKEIARRSGVTQQAVSKALLKHVRDACGRGRTAKEPIILRKIKCRFFSDVHIHQKCGQTLSDTVYGFGSHGP
jgi:predicted transcriptional regulator